MSAEIVPLHPHVAAGAMEARPFAAEPPVDRRMTLEAAQRLMLSLEEEVSGPWSDSVLISLMCHGGTESRLAALAELEARVREVRAR